MNGATGPGAHRGPVGATHHDGAVVVHPVRGIGEVHEGDDLAAAVADAVVLRDGDVVVVAHKIVSKAEGAVVPVPAGGDAAALRLRLARAQARRVVADAPGVLVVETAHGLVCANAGIDASNAAPGTLLTLPADPDASAARLRAALQGRTGRTLAVVVTDTFGRPWRDGLTDVAIGVSGMACIRDERSPVDRGGRRLEVTRVAVVDEVAAAADLARRKADGVPVCVVRGLDWDPDDTASAAGLLRGAEQDQFLRGRGRLAPALRDPEPLRTADDGALRWACEEVRGVLARSVVFDVTPDGRDAAGWLVRCAGTDGNGGQVPAAAQGAAVAVLAAVLTDCGYPARLIVEPEPLVRVGRSAVAGRPPSADDDTTA